jgi:hypothetical protein
MNSAGRVVQRVSSTGMSWVSSRVGEADAGRTVISQRSRTVWALQGLRKPEEYVLLKAVRLG